MDTTLKCEWQDPCHLFPQWASYSAVGQYPKPVGFPPAPTANGMPGITTLNFNHALHNGRILVNWTQDLEHLNFPNLVETNGQYQVSDNPKLLDISFPVLEKWQFGIDRKTNSYANYFVFQASGNALLTNIDFGPWVPNGAWDIDLRQNPSLTQACVDSIVTRFVNATNWKVASNPSPPPAWKCYLKLWGTTLPSAPVQALATAANADPSRNVDIDWVNP